MVVLNPNNWHWVDKNTLPWTREYFETQLTGWSCPADEHTQVVVTRVARVDGDSNVSQRKGKPICYFDLQIALDVKVQGGDDDDEVCSGTVEVPELVHDEPEPAITVSGFDHDWTNTLQARLVPPLTALLSKYQHDLMAQHAGDLQQR